MAQHLNASEPYRWLELIDRWQQSELTIREFRERHQRRLCPKTQRQNQNDESRKAGKVKFAFSCVPAFLILYVLTGGQSFGQSPLYYQIARRQINFATICRFSYCLVDFALSHSTKQ